MRLAFLLSLCLSLLFPTYSQGKECVIITTPKTGTHLLHQLVCEIAKKNKNGACHLFFPGPTMCDRKTYERLLATHDRAPNILHWRPILLSQWSSALTACLKRNMVCHRHSPYSPHLEQMLRKRDIVVFMLMRDPRDVAVSGAHFFFGPEGAQVLKPGSWARKMPMEERLKTMITGTTWWDGMRWIYEAMDGWLSSPICCVIRFEKLLASTERYGRDDQLEELRRIADVLEVKKSDAELLAALKRVYGTSWTFRSGKSGEWKKAFTPQTCELFKKELGDLLIRYGYEQDADW